MYRPARGETGKAENRPARLALLAYLVLPVALAGVPAPVSADGSAFSCIPAETPEDLPRFIELAGDATRAAADRHDCEVEAEPVQLCTPAEAGGSDPSQVEVQLCYRAECASADDGEPAAGLTLGRLAKFCIAVPPGTEAAAVIERSNRSSEPAQIESSDARPATDVDPPFVFRCGDFTGDDFLSATDALGTLRAAVGNEECLGCICDVNGSGGINATDALVLLRIAVGSSQELQCPTGGNPVLWDGGGDGFTWEDPANWDLEDRLPNFCDDVAIPADPDLTVIQFSGDQEIASIVSDSELDLRGGTLRVIDTLLANDTLAFTGGTLVDADVLRPVVARRSAGTRTDIVLAGVGGTLESVTMRDDVDLSAPNSLLRVRGGLVLNGTATMGDFAQIRFEADESQTLSGTGALLFGGTQSSFVAVDAGNTLRIAEEMTLSGTFGVVGDAGDGSRLENAGTIQSDLAGTIRVRSGGGWINDGTILGTGGGDIRLENFWINNGSVSMADGGTLTLAGGWRNNGTIAADGSDVDLAGSFTLADLGDFSASNSEVFLSGTLTNESGVTLGGPLGVWTVDGGRIVGGTVTAGAGDRLGFTDQGGTLVAVTLNLPTDLLADNTLVRVEDGLTVDDTVTLGPGSQVILDGGGPQSLGGSGDIVFGADTNAFVTVAGATQLEVGDSLTIRGRFGEVGSAAAEAGLVNNGTIRAEDGGLILVRGGGGWTNTGAIGAVDGSDLRLDDSWTNEGTVSISGGGTLTLAGVWSNTGSIDADESTVRLDGVFNLGGLGTFSREGGTVEIAGTLENEGNTVSLDEITGDWNLAGGRISGGTVSTSGSGTLVLTDAGGTLDNVTVDGGMDVTSENALAVVTNGVSINGPVAFAPGAQLRFEDTTGQTLGGAASISFPSDDQAFMAVSEGLSLTIGPDVSIRGGIGLIGNGAADVALDVQGTIDADAPGELRLIAGAGGTLSGTVAATAADVRLEGPWDCSGQVGASAGSTVFAQAGLALTSDAVVTVELDDPDLRDAGLVEVNGAATVAGTLVATLAPGYVPEPGDTFVVFAFETLTGDFDTVTLPTLAGTLELVRSVTADEMVLTVVDTDPGQP